MKKIWPLLLFLLLAVLLLKPLFGAVWYPMHDTTHIARTYLLGHALAGGQIPAVWASELNGGTGYPLFHFYAPLTYYLALGAALLTHSYFTGLKIILFLAACSGMLGMYRLTRKWGRAVGILAAVSYALLPYAAVNLYVRGAFAEYLSMGLLPWVFYTWQNLGSRREQLVASLFATLFLLSHNLIPFITAPFLLIWILVHHKKNLRVVVLPMMLTLLLSAFYVVPLVFERHFVEADQIAMTTSYSDHFLVPWQLWNSTWGFGGSAPGVEDGMSFKIGKGQLILALIGLGALLRKKQKKELFFVFLAAGGAYMTTAYARVVWQQVPFMGIVQFPWRYLTLVGLGVSVCAGLSLSLIKNKWLQGLACLLACIMLLVLNLKYFLPQTTFPASLESYTSTGYLETLPSIVPEYRPVWLDRQNPPVEHATVLPYIYYPTWQVSLDGQRVKTFPSTSGMLAVANPTDTTNIVARVGHTELEVVANLISSLALITLIGLYVKN